MMYYLEISRSRCEELCPILDQITARAPGTEHYSTPIQPVAPQYPNVLLPVDERAEAYVTAEEWTTKTTTIPAPFVEPFPPA